MNSGQSNGKNGVKLQKKQVQLLKSKLKALKQQFQTEQSKFLTSSETEYYIVSKQYITDWIDYCQANENERERLKPMNSDLTDAAGQLRKGLIQAQDFQIINPRIYEIIKSDQGMQIRRKAVFVNGQKRVPVYLDVVRYLKLDHKDIRAIDIKQKYLKDFTIKSIQFSMQDTIQNLKKAIKENQNFQTNKIRLWKNNFEDQSVQKLYKYIQDKTRFMMNIYRFDGVGKLIENQKGAVADLNLEEKDYFIAEFCDEYSSYFFKSPDEAKCESCYKYKKLQFVCGCKAVAYCTEECMEKDKRFHMKDCKFAQEYELNQQIEMIITPNSALGKVGLSNLGNTCFMNSCLQCLSNTTPLTQYFLNKYYEKQINVDNPLGSKGKLAKNYAKFIKSMWCSSETTFSPYSLKGAVAKINPIFSGYAQHDSQQFFSFLVDGLHEDLNRVLKKPYVQSVDSKGRPDHVVALESWIAHTQRNQSIIVDLMTGQYKSKVVCPVCDLQSITFDPFTTVSLPIPEEATPGILKYFIIFANTQQEALRMNFQYSKADTKQWLQNAAKMLKRPAEDFMFYILTVFQNIYDFSSTSKTEILHKIEAEGKNVFLLELSPEEKSIKQRVEIVTKFCKKSFHYDKQYDNLWFKRPFWFEKSTTTVLNMYERFVRFLYKIYNQKKLSYEEYHTRIMKERPFNLVIKYKKSIERTYNRVETNFDKEVALNDDNQKLSDILDKLDVKDYELDVRFSKDNVKMFEFEKLKAFQDAGEKIVRKDSRKDSSKQSTVTLDQCFTVFQEKQKLEHGNQWYCPKCKQHRQATKQMSIYKAPDILILHLKRFKNKGILRKQKNETNVQFPIVLNMRKYLIDIQPISSYISQLKKDNKYIEPIFKAEYKTQQTEPEYELYAVSNHYGGLGGGHYTAYAKNKDKWYQFNDSSVRVASEESIGGSGAYMLFYRRKNAFKIK